MSSTRWPLMPSVVKRTGGALVSSCRDRSLQTHFRVPHAGTRGSLRAVATRTAVAPVPFGSLPRVAYGHHMRILAKPSSERGSPHSSYSLPVRGNVASICRSRRRAAVGTRCPHPSRTQDPITQDPINTIDEQTSRNGARSSAASRRAPGCAIAAPTSIPPADELCATSAPRSVPCCCFMKRSPSI